MKWLLILLLFSGFLQGQDLTFLKNFDYRKADSIALSYSKKKYKNVAELVPFLIQNLNTEQEKFRVIFRWITENIEYNRSASGLNESGKVLKRNKAVCIGFSRLLKEMCDAANIPCQVIVGYTKTDVSDIGRKLRKTDHAWNCVLLYGVWYLCDVTWATSKFNVVTHKFQKEFDGHYFLTPAAQFILDHFPKDVKYQFLDRKAKKKTFRQSPVYYANYFHSEIQTLRPEQGSFSWKKDVPLDVVVQSKTGLMNAAVLLSTGPFLLPAIINQDPGNGSYRFQCVFPVKGRVIFTIYLNHECVAEYLVKVK